MNIIANKFKQLKKEREVCYGRSLVFIKQIKKNK